ncbi:P-loop NTPase fold protein [Paraburkholderia azotifigens]|uniref:KAP family P-loop NTPase fold protein n=1 Tax=Paraburkholderia azotifigens TaxID=2057004 RepID=UPI003171D60D
MAQSQTVTFQHDQPQVESDLYGRKPFAEKLGRLLVLPTESPGIVIGVEGPWGSGKTTVVRYIVESLKKTPDEPPIVVEFNPWMLAGAGALVEALLTELASGIGMDARRKKAKKSLEAAGKILGYAGLLRHLKYLKYVPGVSLVGVAADTVGTALHDASELATKAATAADSAKKVVEEAEKLVAVKVGLAERKKEVVKALKKLDRSIVVVVDDLDRLTPDEIKAVFRTIKAVADFPRVAYLLAYDRNVVSESLGGGPFAGGDAYIEKIVQVAYPISPAFPWQLHGHIAREISRLLTLIRRELEPFESELIARATTVACSLCRYPRDIVRLINRLTLSLASTKHEVNAADIIVAEALFQRFPKIREAVVQNPERFTGTFWSVENEIVATDWSMYLSVSKEERRNAWQEHLPGDKADSAVATGALKFLFPLITGISPSSYPVSHLRLAELSRLIRFFARTSVMGVQEVADIHGLLADPSEVGELLNDLDYAKAVEMVNHMTAYLQTARSVDGSSLVRQLIRSCTSARLAATGMRDFSRAVAELTANCLQGCGAELPVLVHEFVVGTPLAYGLDLLIMVGMHHGQVRGVEEHKVRDATDFVTDSSAVTSAIETWRKRAAKSISSGSIMEEGDFFAVLYGLANLGSDSRNADAIDSFRWFCVSVNGGLEFFLKEAEPFKEFQVNLFFLYVWDANEMAALVEQCSASSEYEWYATRLRTDAEAQKYVAARGIG